MFSPKALARVLVYVLCTNIDSLINIREEFLIRVADSSPDVIGLTEVQPKNPRYLLQPAEIVIDGYDCWHAIDSVGRGVALYTRTSLAATSVVPLPGRSSDDAVWCEIRLHRGDEMIVGCIYRSPNSTRDNNKLLLDMMQTSNDDSYSRVIIMHG